MEYISSKDNSKIMKFKKLVTNKKFRKSENLFVCEGEKILYEALEQNVLIDTIILSEKIKLKKELKDLEVILVPQHLMEKISDTKTPQGVIFSCVKTESNIDFSKLNKVIILDNLQDPGNLGTIIRSAVAFNIDAIILLNDCVDYLSPKVVRSTMSAIFKIPIIEMDLETCFSKLDMPIFATYLSKDSISISKVNMSRCAVIIGNESKGVSKQVLEYANEKIIIPMENMESLNACVAGSIVMWEMSKTI